MNTIEGYFSIFKRSTKGIYQHCQEKHLPRDLAEYDFHYNHRIAPGIDDASRTALALKCASGKRQTINQLLNSKPGSDNLRRSPFSADSPVLESPAGEPWLRRRLSAV
jgi:hypothetical protein